MKSSFRIVPALTLAFAASCAPHGDREPADDSGEQNQGAAQTRPLPIDTRSELRWAVPQRTQRERDADRLFSKADPRCPLVGDNTGLTREIVESIPAVELSPDSLLKKGLNPVTAGVPVSSLMKELFEVFDSGSASFRQFDHLERLDGVTIGIGHWPQAEVEGYFRSLAETSKARDRFFHRAYSYFRRNPDDLDRLMYAYARSSARAFGRLTTGDDPDFATVKRAVAGTLFGSHFMSRYRGNATNASPMSARDPGNTWIGTRNRGGNPSLFEEHPWFRGLFAETMRDPLIARWAAVCYEDYLLKDAIQDAADLGVPTRSPRYSAFVVGLASTRSSAPGWVRQFKRMAADGNHRVLSGLQSWSWDQNPCVEDANPMAIRRISASDPERAANLTADLESWRLLVHWQWYCQKKDGVRSRHETYFRRYLDDRWGFYSGSPRYQRGAGEVCRNKISNLKYKPFGSSGLRACKPE